MKSIFRCAAGPLVLVCVILLLFATGAMCEPGACWGREPNGRYNCEACIVSTLDCIENSECEGDGGLNDLCQSNLDCASNRCYTDDRQTERGPHDPCHCLPPLEVSGSEIAVSVINADQQNLLVVRLSSDQETVDVTPSPTTGVPAEDVNLTVAVGSSVEVTSFIDGVMQATNACSVDAATIDGGFGQVLVVTDVIICSEGFANAE